MALWCGGTCAQVGGVGVAAPLDELRGQAALVEGCAVHHRGRVLEGVDGVVGGQRDVLQGQPQRRAALVVLELQVQPDPRLREGSKRW